MSTIVYKTCSEVETSLVHICDACNNTEMARVRGVALIKPGTQITVPAEANEWQTAITAGNIHIIPNTTGSLEDAEKEGDGYGDEKSRLLGHDYTLTFKDPNYTQNKAFYEAAEKMNWNVAFRTETQLHIITDAKATLVAKQTIDESLDSPVVWEVTMKWTSDTKPQMTPCAPVRSLFECFEVVEDNE